ncbi:MAG: hypothetical protein KAJ48_09455 [Elusimicrobiales bacterium]|nr:hypothetical protein [Elusimicrobiales bacterium]
MKTIFTRAKQNPILKPTKNQWENLKVYNPGAIYYQNKHHLFYRAMGKSRISSIGYATSVSGEKFIRDKNPLLKSKLKIESRGLEDPRISQVGNKFFLTYTAYDNITARLCLMTSPDLKNWQRHNEIFPNWDSKRAGEFFLPWDPAQANHKAKHHWLKAGTIFPEKINGKYWLFFGDRLIWYASSENGTSWVPEYEPLLKPRRGFFDSVHVEMGPPPLRTKQGWLILYHGIDESITYRLGYLLLDLHNPLKILKRSKTPIFEPRKNYELGGQIDITQNKEYLPQVIFCNGAILEKNCLCIYYGAGDSVICTATANLDDVLNSP